MRQDLAKYFGIYSDIDTTIQPVFPEPEEDPEIDSDVKQLLDEIFSVDPLTGLPKGDLQYWLSKDGNPQVKNFIESCLLAPRNPNGMYEPDKVTDDMIVEFSRGRDESLVDYTERLSGLRQSALDELEKLQNPET